MSMPQDRRRFDDATIRVEGEAELHARNAAFRAERSIFADADDLVDHLGHVFGRQPAEGGVRGTMSRKGTQIHRPTDGTPAVTLGDPVLDLIASADGTVVIGGRTIDLADSPGPGGGVVPADADDLVYTGEVNGVEQWKSLDGSMVQYRSTSGTLTFHAWKRSTFYGYWSMGGEITTTGGNFEAANIDSHYYMTVPGQDCAVVAVDQDSDRDDSYVDEYEWGWNAPQPEGVTSLCRAQWNGARFADLVTAGEVCPGYLQDAWPIGWPADWPPDMGVEVQPDHLTMHVKSIGVSAGATTEVINHDSDAVTVQVDDGQDSDFSYPTGTFTLQGNGHLPITVIFSGGNSTGVYTTSLRIVAGGQVFVVPVTATVTQVGPPL